MVYFPKKFGYCWVPVRLERISTALAIHPLAGFLRDFYRLRYPFACWISIAFVIHSLDHSLSSRLISAGAGNRDLEIAPTTGNRDLEIEGFLQDFYGISTALAIHSLAGFLSPSLSAQLITRYSLACWISIAVIMHSLDHLPAW